MLADFQTRMQSPTTALPQPPGNRIADLNIERRRQKTERERTRRFDRYVSRPGPEKKKRGRDPREALPESNDIEALADTFGASDRRRRQAQALERHGLHSKAKRVVLCGRLGRRLNCLSEHAREHRFFRPYRCHGRYCEVCGPAWFRKKFSDLLSILPPVIEQILKTCRERGIIYVIAKLDFTIPNTGQMPKLEQVRDFHRALHDFWRLVERLLYVRRDEYGQVGCDEFGGSNTNLHRHSLYVGPTLPQHNKELSALWSLANITDRARRRELIRLARKKGVRFLWDALRPEERRFASIKRARSFQAALAHALKYPSKFLSHSTPERLAELEAAFHKTRRFSTGGAFYRIKVEREPGEECELGHCPLCGSPLAEQHGVWEPRSALEAEGRRDIEEVRRQVAKQRVMGIETRERGSP